MKKLIYILRRSLWTRTFLLHLICLSGISWFFRLYAVTQMLPFEPQNFGKAVLYSVAFDAAVGVYSFLPFTMVGWFFLRQLSVGGLKRFYFWFLTVELATWFFFWGAEFFFFQEFKDRFNFIAVDYLVYSNEVIRNIWESYPIIWILSAIGVFAALLSAPAARFLYRRFPLIGNTNPFKTRFLYGYGILFALMLLFVNEQKILERAGPYEEVLGKNGLHSLFAAYRNNEINYERFYPGISLNEAQAKVKNLMGAGAPPDFEANGRMLRRIKGDRAEKKMNVVLVLMESMSARFMKAYGNEKEITPNLDRLAREGLFFDHLYSTGTRTVRGIEAVMLSIPPTPGQSIVRRPAGQGLFNIGSEFQQRGYKTQFIYGGFGIFDNMNEFFAGNGFENRDQFTFPKDEIHFRNAWGICDEDLFAQSLKEADLAYKNGKPFFQFVLTVSNHRPYTFPEGRIDLPSGKSGRDGAVKYSDYAIGKFLEEAKSKPWYDNTIFIFVADHNASVSGGSKIIPEDFRIPVIFYQPKAFAAKVVSNLSSQIDIAPTLFGLLNFSYESRFFGADLLRENPNRTFLGTYVQVALMENDKLTVLSPGYRVDSFAMKNGLPTLLRQEKLPDVSTQVDREIIDTVAFYKLASDQFSQGLLKLVARPKGL